MRTPAFVDRRMHAGDDPVNLIDPTGTRNCTSIAFTGQIKCSDGAPSNKKALERACFVAGVLALRFVRARLPGVACLGYSGWTAFESNK